jgi:hypothetical protein
MAKIEGCMAQNRQSRIVNNIVSPYGLAMISYAFFLFSCLIPPSVYTLYMNEPDLMFLDPATILFYTTCVASFVAGVWLVSCLFPSQFLKRRLETRTPPVLFLLAPLILGIGITSVSMFLLLKQVPTLFLLVLSQKGGDVKEALAFEVEGRFTFAPLLLTAICWWAFSRYFDLDIAGWKKRGVAFFLVIGVLTVVAASVLMMSRNLLMPAACGMTILYALHHRSKQPASLKFLLKGTLNVVLSVSLIFFAFSFLRGTDNWNDQVHGLLGYTAASYNRLAAVVNGRLHYPFAGSGAYLSSVAAHTRLLPFAKIFTPPDALAIWGSEFGAVSQAGLDGNLIWSGAFGYIFSDLGWFSLPFVFGYGLLYGVVWNWCKCGRACGIVLYPWFGFCILFWLGTNYLLDAPAEIMLVSAFLLTGYEYVFLKRSARYVNPIRIGDEKELDILPRQFPSRSNG